MKICEEFAALLDAFVDGELSPEEAQAVQTHLNTCSACQAYVDDALAMRAAFPTVEDTEVPANFATGVMDAICAQAAPTEKRHHQPWGRVLLPIAACFALVLILKTASPMSKTEAEAHPNAAASLASDPRTLEDAPPEALAPTQESLPESSEDTALAENSQVPSVAAYNRRDAELPLYFARITLTAQEAGDLLSSFSPISETETERIYELTDSDYHALLDALDAAGISPAVETADTEAPDALALVTILY